MRDGWPEGKRLSWPPVCEVVGEYVSCVLCPDPARPGMASVIRRLDRPGVGASNAAEVQQRRQRLQRRRLPSADLSVAQSGPFWLCWQDCDGWVAQAGTLTLGEIR